MKLKVFIKNLWHGSWGMCEDIAKAVSRGFLRSREKPKHNGVTSPNSTVTTLVQRVDEVCVPMRELFFPFPKRQRGDTVMLQKYYIKIFLCPKQPTSIYTPSCNKKRPAFLLAIIILALFSLFYLSFLKYTATKLKDFNIQRLYHEILYSPNLFLSF